MSSNYLDYPSNLFPPVFNLSGAFREHSSCSFDQSQGGRVQATQHSRCSASLPACAFPTSGRSGPAIFSALRILGRIPSPEAMQLLPSEWVISQASFLQLLRLQNLQVDLFAHPGNARLPVFGYPFRQPRAADHYARTADWNRWSASYLFRPPALFPVCLRKFHEFVDRGNLVAPALPSTLW